MKKVIKFNVFNFMDINDLNNILDDQLLDSKIDGIASDISYKVKTIDKSGNITIISDFTLDKL